MRRAYNRSLKNICFTYIAFIAIGFSIGIFLSTYIKRPLLIPHFEVCFQNPRIEITAGVISNNPSDYWKPVSSAKVGIAVLEDRKRYVCPMFVGHFGGRLGNIMFLYASNYGLAADLNLTLSMSNNDSIYEPFENVPRSQIKRPQLCQSYDHYNQPYGRIYVNFPVLQKGSNVRFIGWLQSWKYFSHSFDDIRQQFVWKMHIRKRALKIISNLVKLQYGTDKVNANYNVTTVAIHIRRGDFIFYKKPMADKRYIESAKKYFMTRHKRLLFIVATNPDTEAHDWCTYNVINGSGVSMMTGNNDQYVDLAILTLTDHIIISTGTYGWWGGFLNKGTVVHYDWIPPMYYQSKREDFILPWWVGIKSTTKYHPGPPMK